MNEDELKGKMHQVKGRLKGRRGPVRDERLRQEGLGRAGGEISDSLGPTDEDR